MSKLSQRSDPRTLLFIVVMELIGRTVFTIYTVRKLLYAADLAILTESKRDFKESIDDCKVFFQ